MQNRRECGPLRPVRAIGTRERRAGSASSLHNANLHKTQDQGTAYPAVPHTRMCPPARAGGTGRRRVSYACVILRKVSLTA